MTPDQPTAGAMRAARVIELQVCPATSTVNVAAITTSDIARIIDEHTGLPDKEAEVAALVDLAGDVLHWSDPDAPPTTGSDRTAAAKARQGLRELLSRYPTPQETEDGKAT